MKIGKISSVTFKSSPPRQYSTFVEQILNVKTLRGKDEFIKQRTEDPEPFIL